MMDKLGSGGGFGIIIIILLLVGAVYFSDDIKGFAGIDDPVDQPTTTRTNYTASELVVVKPYNSIRVANWNLQVFGASKWQDDDSRRYILDAVDDYDIIFIQDIREESGDAFDDLCAQTTGYNCIISSRAGRTSSKEQYGLLYTDDILILKVVDYNEHYISDKDYWERPPLKVTFRKDDYVFTAYNIHVKPDDVELELVHLEALVSLESNLDTENVMILGDLNADGDYYDEEKIVSFTTWVWAIENDVDTTVADSDNTYDRIILNFNMEEELLNTGVTSSIPASVSDHYIIWADINYGGLEK